MRRRLTALAPLAVALGVVLTGCGQQGPPPCDRLEAPSPAAIDATREGLEVEDEVEYESLGTEHEAECVVVLTRTGAEWQDQTDDAS